MANARGTDLIDAEAFVRETHGPASASRVLDALDEPASGVFHRPIRETDWYPLEVLTSYLTVAKALLEPTATDFYRRQGYYAAQRRRQGPLRPMVVTAELRMHLAKVVWLMFYDTGHLEDTPAAARARIHGFPATPELCERFRGIWEGMAAPGARAEETQCVLRGDPYCDLRIVRDSPE